ncbi:hypothetical protein SUGI_0025180 [Cryptomeria japonica]|nr:hypothetical protein SUGI_0025180 [Cryptomeria japonica]
MLGTGRLSLCINTYIMFSQFYIGSLIESTVLFNNILPGFLWNGGAEEQIYTHGYAMMINPHTPRVHKKKVMMRGKIKREIFSSLVSSMASAISNIFCCFKATSMGPSLHISSNSRVHPI